MNLLILKYFADGNIHTVMVAYNQLAYWCGRLELEKNPTLELQNKIKSESARKNATTPRTKDLLDLQIEEIIKNNIAVEFRPIS